MPIATPEGYRYFVTFICTKTDYWATACLRKKSDTSWPSRCSKLKLNVSILVFTSLSFRRTRGEEYMSAEFINFCAEHGIRHRHTEPDEPYQNGQAEHANRTISEGANAILIESKLPATFWGHAVPFLCTCPQSLPYSCTS